MNDFGPRPTTGCYSAAGRGSQSRIRPPTKSGAILQAALHDVFPELRDARIDDCWGGMVDMTRDRLPRASERNGIYDSINDSGHGTQMFTLNQRSDRESAIATACPSPFAAAKEPPKFRRHVIGDTLNARRK